jgi:hypothetical protein
MVPVLVAWNSLAVSFPQLQVRAMTTESTGNLTGT